LPDTEATTAGRKRKPAVADGAESAELLGCIKHSDNYQDNKGSDDDPLYAHWPDPFKSVT